MLCLHVFFTLLPCFLSAVYQLSHGLPTSAMYLIKNYCIELRVLDLWTQLVTNVSFPSIFVLWYYFKCLECRSLTDIKLMFIAFDDLQELIWIIPKIWFQHKLPKKLFYQLTILICCRMRQLLVIRLKSIWPPFKIFNKDSKFPFDHLKFFMLTQISYETSRLYTSNVSAYVCSIFKSSRLSLNKFVTSWSNSEVE